MTRNFWIIWSPTGSYPPSKRHYDYGAAKQEAERLAGTVPKAEFFVMRAVSRSQKVSVVTELVGDNHLDSEIPF